MYQEEQDGPGVYMPTAEEIREACRDIQKQWTAATRRKRCAFAERPVQMQEVNTIESFGNWWKYCG